MHLRLQFEFKRANARNIVRHEQMPAPVHEVLILLLRNNNLLPEKMGLHTEEYIQEHFHASEFFTDNRFHAVLVADVFGIIPIRQHVVLLRDVDRSFVMKALGDKKDGVLSEYLLRPNYT